MVLAAVQPGQVVPADEHLDVGAGLVQQRGRLQCTLAAAHDQYPLALEGGQVAVFAGVRGELARQAGELRRAAGEGRDPRGDDHPAGAHPVAVGELELEAGAGVRQFRDDPTVDLRRDLGLNPLAVRDEVLQRDRPAEPDAGCRLVRVQRHRAPVVRDGGRRPVRPEQHPLWHLAPERHRIAEHPVRHPAATQCRGDGESVRARSEHDHIGDGHARSPLDQPGRPRFRIITEMNAEQHRP